MNQSIDFASKIAEFILLAVIVLAFLGILFSSVYYALQTHAGIKRKKSIQLRYQPKNLIDLYKQFEMLIRVQLNVPGTVLHIKRPSKTKLSSTKFKLKNKPIKNIDLSGMVCRPLGAIGLLFGLAIVFMQIVSIYMAANLQGSTLFVVGWATIIVWLSISAFMSDLPVKNKLILLMFSPIVYFLALIRLIVSTVLSMIKTKIAI